MTKIDPFKSEPDDGRDFDVRGNTLPIANAEGQGWRYLCNSVGGGYTVYRGKHPAFGFQVSSMADAMIALAALNAQAEVIRLQAALTAAEETLTAWDAYDGE